MAQRKQSKRTIKRSATFKGFQPIISFLPSPEEAPHALIAKIRDDILVRSILFGEDLMNDQGEYAVRVIEPGSDLEQEARAALARMLLSNKPLDKATRVALALLFDPNSDHPQQLILKTRPTGPGDVTRDFNIAVMMAIAEHAKIPTESAAADAMQRFGVKRSTAFKARARFKNLIRPDTAKEWAEDRKMLVRALLASRDPSEMKKCSLSRTGSDD